MYNGLNAPFYQTVSTAGTNQFNNNGYNGVNISNRSGDNYAYTNNDVTQNIDLSGSSITGNVGYGVYAYNIESYKYGSNPDQTVTLTDADLSGNGNGTYDASNAYGTQTINP